MKNKIKLPDVKKLPNKDDGFIRWFWFFVSPYKLSFFVQFTSRFLKFLIGGLSPFYVGEMISIFETGAVMQNHWLFWQLFILILALQAFAYLDYLVSPYRTLLKQKASSGLTLFSLNYISKLSLLWHKENATGGKIQKIMTSRRGIENTTMFFIENIPRTLGSFVGTFFSLFLIGAPFIFYFVLMAYSFIYISLSWKGLLKAKKHQHSKNFELEKLLSKVYEFISSIFVTKSFGLEKYINKKSENGENKIINISFEIGKKTRYRWLVLALINHVFMIALLLMSFFLIINQSIEVAVFATVIMAFGKVEGLVDTIANLQNNYFVNKIDFLRIKKTLCQKPENLDIAPLVKLNKNWRKITFDSVGFYYPDDKTKTNVLKNFNLTINRNEKIGIVGTSGSGKSTLINLLMKQMLVTDGKIMVDNKNLLNIKQSDWLAEIGLVPQDVSLFNLSLRENISMGHVVTKAQLNKYLKLSYCKNFIDKLPHGVDTILGERAIKISGGQKQRIGIARALAKESEIMIFDEATSALDGKSEKYIQDAIDSSFGDKTLLVIAHRLSTLKNMDRIIVMNRGRVAEMGTHRQLLAKRGIYYKMWNVQNEKKVCK